MTTINDIAKMAQVSRTTVSRVLNNNGNVHPDIKKRVQEVIEKTGYVPSQFAKSLRTKQTKIIGVILPRLTTDTVNRFLETFAKKVQENGYQTILYNTGLDKNKEVEAFSILASRRVDGIIHFATNVSRNLKETIQSMKIPVVIIGQDFQLDNQIIENNYLASQLLTQKMIEKGYKKIGFIGVPEADKSVGVVRKKGYIDTLLKNGISVEHDFIEYANFDYKTGYEAMGRLLKNKKRPEAVIAVTDRMATGAIQCIHDTGLKVPDDIAIAGMGASPLSFYLTPRLTTVDFNNEVQGEIACEMIMQLINTGNSISQKTKMIDPILIMGESF